MRYSESQGFGVPHPWASTGMRESDFSVPGCQSPLLVVVELLAPFVRLVALVRVLIELHEPLKRRLGEAAIGVGGVLLQAGVGLEEERLRLGVLSLIEPRRSQL